MISTVCCKKECYIPYVLAGSSFCSYGVNVSYYCSFWQQHQDSGKREGQLWCALLIEWGAGHTAGETRWEKTFPKPITLMPTTLGSVWLYGTMFTEMTNLGIQLKHKNSLSLVRVVYILMLHLMPESALLNVSVVNFLKWKVFPNPTFHLSVTKGVMRGTLSQSPKNKGIQASKIRTSQNILLGLQI